MSGVYGDDIQLSEANSELIPLLKRVIALLQEKGISLSATRLPPGYHAGVGGAAQERPAKTTLALRKDEASLPVSAVIYEGKTQVYLCIQIRLFLRGSVLVQNIFERCILLMF